MYDAFGTPGFLAAYNAGPARLSDYLTRNRSLPDETRRYVYMIGSRIAGTWPQNRSPAEQMAVNQIPISIPAGPRWARHTVQTRIPRTHRRHEAANPLCLLAAARGRNAMPRWKWPRRRSPAHPMRPPCTFGHGRPAFIMAASTLFRPRWRRADVGTMQRHASVHVQARTHAVVVHTAHRKGLR